jgi:hypothetical protein
VFSLKVLNPVCIATAKKGKQLATDGEQHFPAYLD